MALRNSDLSSLVSISEFHSSDSEPISYSLASPFSFRFGTQFDHISPSRARREVLSGIRADAAVDDDDDCARVRAEGAARAARPGRPMGQPGARPRNHRVLLAQRHRPGARGLAGPLPGERGAQGAF